MKVDQYDIVYFVGIGGIGMSALARWFAQKGASVSGYDRTPTALTESLTREGILIHYRDEINEIPEEVILNKEKVLVIYTPAIPKDHKGFEYLFSNGYVIKKRSQVLGMLTENRFTVAVAGTHGKTTTSTMIAHVLNYAGKNCDAFLGGLSNNINSNLLISKNAAEDSIMVVEADEYDRSFLTLHPNLAVVTSADSDHLDIYGDKDSVAKSFGEFINQCTVNSTLVIKEGLENLKSDERKDIKVLPYAVKGTRIKADNIRIEKDVFVFDYISDKVNINDIRLKVPGFHNVENAIAACTVALELGIQEGIVRQALGEFSGVKRRFEYIVRTGDVVYIDDYAHHPVEIEAFLKSVRALYPGRKIKAVFQPHLFSRTRDFMKEFGESLSLADEVLLLDIYPARELPIEGITSQSLLECIDTSKKSVCSVDQALANIKDQNNEILVTIGAGDIDKMVQPIKEILKRKSDVA